jgi:tripartite-type tricarboxylate transporter receptor subunit TctC
MSIRTDLPYTTMKEFFDAVRKEPGKYTMAISGTKSIWYALARELEQTANLKFTYIPFDGGAPAAAAVAGKHVDCCMIDMATILSLFQAGELKVIGYFGKERNPLIPNAQTAIEIGYPKLTLVSWFGIVLPNGVDKAIMNKISASIKVAMEDPKVVEFFKGSGAGTVNGYMPQEEFTEFMKRLDSMYKVFFKQ